jgi:hypothetical protein
MSDPDRLDVAIAALKEDRYEETLRIVLEIQAEAERADPTLKPPEFMLQFTWEQLAQKYEPARIALAGHRDAQVRRLLAGDIDTEARSPGYRYPRFGIIAELNAKLGDTRATCALFLQLLERMPEQAAGWARHALPALIEAGDFALASRYMPDPLPDLPRLNACAAELPLFPPPGTAPRLAGELSNFTREVRQRAAILDGLGRMQEAAALRAEALDGIASADMRALARRDLEAPGSIVGTLVEHQIRLEGREPQA